jgi:F-type H+-transporting ATPase subunit gamma
MASLKEVRSRISSVVSTQQITKAMKMVSAAKLRRAQDAIVRMRPYANKLKDILENVSATVDASEGGAYAKARPEEKILLVPICSNRGLAGAFNANIMRNVNREIREKYAEQAAKGQVKVVCVGRKASDYFNKQKGMLLRHHNDIYDHPDFEHAAPIAEALMQEFLSGNFDKVVLVYNQFRNAAVQDVQVEQMLPILPPAKTEKKAMANDYIFEPGKEEIVRDLIPKSLKIQFYKALLDSHASEHGARMTAMNKATDNAGELLRELRLQYNKARQAAITNEILEIVGGAEALKNA